VGAALTYARRYALFTLVGIAGEDDLDTPDLAITVGTEQHPDASFEQRPGGQVTAATPDSRPPIDRPDQPRSAGRIKAIPSLGRTPPGCGIACSPRSKN
jgi:hypothetical protein